MTLADPIGQASFYGDRLIHASKNAQGLSEIRNAKEKEAQKYLVRPATEASKPKSQDSTDISYTVTNKQASSLPSQLNPGGKNFAEIAFKNRAALKLEASELEEKIKQTRKAVEAFQELISEISVQKDAQEGSQEKTVKVEFTTQVAPTNPDPIKPSLSSLKHDIHEAADKRRGIHINEESIQFEEPQSIRKALRREVSFTTKEDIANAYSSTQESSHPRQEKQVDIVEDAPLKFQEHREQPRNEKPTKIREDFSDTAAPQDLKKSKESSLKIQDLPKVKERKIEEEEISVEEAPSPPSEDKRLQKLEALKTASFKKLKSVTVGEGTLPPSSPTGSDEAEQARFAVPTPVFVEGNTETFSTTEKSPSDLVAAVEKETGRPFRLSESSNNAPPLIRLLDNTLESLRQHREKLDTLQARYKAVTEASSDQENSIVTLAEVTDPRDAIQIASVTIPQLGQNSLGRAQNSLPPTAVLQLLS